MHSKGILLGFPKGIKRDSRAFQRHFTRDHKGTKRDFKAFQRHLIGILRELIGISRHFKSSLLRIPMELVQ